MTIGVAYLGTRQVAGMIMSTLGVLFIVRELGPNSYGMLAISTSVLGYIGRLSSLGIHFYIARHPDEAVFALVPAAVTLNALLGLMSATAAALSAPLLAAWVGDSRITDLVRALLPGYLAGQIGLVYIALLERELRYRELGFIELGGLAVYYLTAIPLVYLGLGYWGVVVGYSAQALVATVSYAVMRPRHPLRSHRVGLAQFRKAIAYGTIYQCTGLLAQMKDMTLPFIVARWLGLEAAGTIALARQLAERLAFLRVVTWRISLSGLARVIEKPEAVAAALGQFMRIHALVTGPALALAASLGPWLIPPVLGNEWIAAMKIFPFIGAALLVNGLFTPQCSALQVRANHGPVVLQLLAHAATFWGVTAAFSTPLGIFGYGVAELASLWSLWILHRTVTLKFGPLRYPIDLLLVAWAVIPLFVGPLLSPAIATLCWAAAAVAFSTHMLLSRVRNRLQARYPT